MSTQWLRIGLTRESAPAEVPGYVPVLDTSFSAGVAPTSGGGGAELPVTVTNPDVYLYSAPGFHRDLQIIDAALPVGHPLSVQWVDTSLDGAAWLWVRTDTVVGTVEGYVAATRTSYSGGAPTAPVRRIQSSQVLPGQGATRTALITEDETRIRANAAAGASDPILGYLDESTTVTVLLRTRPTIPKAW